MHSRKNFSKTQRILLKDFKYYLAGVAFLVLFIGNWTTGHNWGDDFSAYIMQASSIVRGDMRQYVLANEFTINQSSHVIGPITYPWGYPLILAPIFAIFGINLFAFKFVGLFFYSLFLILLHYGFKKYLNSKELFIFVILFAFNPYILNFSDNILSDIPFLFFSTFSIIAINNAFSGNEFNLKNLTAIGVFGGICSQIRPNGILIELTYALLVFMCFISAAFQISTNYFISRNYSSKGKLNLTKISILLYPIIIFLLIHIFVFFFTPYSQNTHYNLLSEVNIESILSNILYYGVIIADFFSPTKSLRWLGLIFYLFLIPFGFLGLRCSWKRFIPICIYLICTAALFFIWPGRQGLRFFFPVIPFFIYFVIVGLRHCKEAYSKKKVSYLLPLIVLAWIFFTSASFNAYKNISGGGEYGDGPFTPESLDMFNYVKVNSLESDIIVFRKPRLMYLMTGRPSVRYDNEESFKYLNYLVIDKKNNDGEVAIFEGNDFFVKNKLRLVYRNKQFDIYSGVLTQDN